jgi:site-specific DNA-methyltransferase (adenine-specific)
MSKKTKLMLGDNITSLKKLPDNSIDSVVTDGPYGLTFMGKKWDYDVPSVEFWKEVWRVLKPGGHILSFGGTRTYHRMTVNIEDAGFEIRDQIMWLYGSGFPKSHNIGKAVDKLQGNDREVVGKSPNERLNTTDNDSRDCNGLKKELNITKGTSPYEGWGTALKPANEPICVARKPLSEKSVAENVLRWGTGGINVDGCRVATDDDTSRKTKTSGFFNSDEIEQRVNGGSTEGRFPANIILECCCDEVIKGEKGEVKKTNRIRKGEAAGGLDINEKRKAVEGIDNYGDKGDIHTNPMCPCFIMDEQSGDRKGMSGGGQGNGWFNNHKNQEQKEKQFYNDKGGASRFFYQAKVSKAERNMGLDGFEDKNYQINQKHNSKTLEERYNLKTKNNHPTVKPVSLMAYLCRLITPPNGIVLDPFMGSGSTGISAQLEGFRFVGMEMDKDYFKIAESRIENYEQYRKFIKK